MPETQPIDRTMTLDPDRVHIRGVASIADGPIPRAVLEKWLPELEKGAFIYPMLPVHLEQGDRPMLRIVGAHVLKATLTEDGALHLVGRIAEGTPGGEVLRTLAESKKYGLTMEASVRTTQEREYAWKFFHVFSLPISK